MDQLELAVIDVVRRVLSPEYSGLLTDLDNDLARAGVSSLEMVELMCELERRFAIKFRDEQIDAATFRTVRTVVDAVRALQIE